MLNIDWQDILQQIKSFLKQAFLLLLPILKNKYVLVAGFFLLTIVFGEDNIFNFIENRNHIEKLETEKAQLLEAMRQDSVRIQSLKKRDVLEKFAREKYFMKRDDEVLFIIK